VLGPIGMKEGFVDCNDVQTTSPVHP
jgi:hypothetical protein